jgi:hypothetical protein
MFCVESLELIQQNPSTAKFEENENQNKKSTKRTREHLARVYCCSIRRLLSGVVKKLRERNSNQMDLLLHVAARDVTAGDLLNLKDSSCVQCNSEVPLSIVLVTQSVLFEIRILNS